MIGSMSERAPLHQFADARISKLVSVSEQALLRGVYTAELTRPKPGLEARYEPLFIRRAFLENIPLTLARPLTDYERRELAELFVEMWPMADVVWRDTAVNTVCTVGKNLALDTFLAGSSYTVTGPYMGLISSTSWSATAAADTMASHSGWLEAGNANAPTYTSPRKTAAWSSASSGSKALSAALNFAITGSGTVKGCFLVYGSAAVTTIDNTSGTIMSAGVFTGGDKLVANLDSLAVSYSLAF